MTKDNTMTVTFSAFERAQEHALKFLDTAHLTGDLKRAAEPFAALARHILDVATRNPERIEALRLLVLAKEAAVRAAATGEPVSLDDDAILFISQRFTPGKAEPFAAAAAPFRQLADQIVYHIPPNEDRNATLRLLADARAATLRAVAPAAEPSEQELLNMASGYEVRANELRAIAAIKKAEREKAEKAKAPVKKEGGTA